MSKKASKNGPRVRYISADYTDKDRDHCNLLGWSFEQLTSWHLFVTWHPDYISRSVEQLHRAAVGRRPQMASVALDVVYMGQHFMPICDNYYYCCIYANNHL